MSKVEDSNPGSSSNASSNQSGSNDFVKKLFQMLQEDSYKDVVRWTTNGDSFVVINTTEFTKDILPRHFKHSNFASFVRQLNKYDFHKVKIPNEEKQNYIYGDDAWEFKHPNFKINDRNSLENIRRKGPSVKKSISTVYGPNGASLESSYLKSIREEVDILKQENSTLHHEIQILQVKYKTLIENIISLKTFDERIYQTMSVMNNCLVQAGIKLPSVDIPNPNLISMSSADIGRPGMNSNTADINSVSRNIISDIANENSREHLKNTSPASFDTPFVSNSTLGKPTPVPQIPSNVVSHPHKLTTDNMEAIKAKQHTSNNGSSSNVQGALVNPILGGSSNSIASIGTPRLTGSHIPSSAAESLRMAEPTNLTVTSISNPKFHVLLVEDDNICIQLCRKFLVKYGCQVTVATDGLNAISTIEHTKYDLVLMDIVMPNLDGATATSVIRSFDTRTPIIAMTGNIEDNDLVTYLQNGMSDILAKPFTKEDLYSILSKHLLSNANSQGSATPAGGDTATSEISNNAQSNMMLASDPQDHVANASSGSISEQPLIKKQKLV